MKNMKKCQKKVMNVGVYGDSESANASDKVVLPLR